MRSESDSETILTRWLESCQAHQWSALAGVVTAFDAGPPATVTVESPVWQLVPSTDDPDDFASEPLPPLPNVPIVYPRGGGVTMTWPLNVGDAVLLIFTDLHPHNWRRTGEPGPPLDPSRKSLSSAYALPGIVADALAQAAPNVAGLAIRAQALTVLSPTVRLGIDTVDDTADQFVALANKVDAELSALQTLLGTAVVVPSGGGPVAFVYSPNSVAASRVKVR